MTTSKIIKISLAILFLIGFGKLIVATTNAAFGLAVTIISFGFFLIVAVMTFKLLRLISKSVYKAIRQSPMKNSNKKGLEGN